MTGDDSLRSWIKAGPYHSYFSLDSSQPPSPPFRLLTTYVMSDAAPVSPRKRKRQEADSEAASSAVSLRPSTKTNRSSSPTRDLLAGLHRAIPPIHLEQGSDTQWPGRVAQLINT